MPNNSKCPNCCLRTIISGIKSCYQKKISSDFYINHLILDNDIHLIRSNQEFSFSDIIFWIEENSYDRYYYLNGVWYQWSLKYDLNAIFFQQILNNCQLENIPLGFALLYLTKIQKYIS